LSPLDQARRYQAELDRPGVRTKIQVAKRLGGSYIRMLQVQSLLKLDPRIVEYLAAHYGDPVVSGTFSGKRLRRLMAAAGEGGRGPNSGPCWRRRGRSRGYGERSREAAGRKISDT
jgi:hypothetical protein